jgi:IS30 family transposase
MFKRMTIYDRLKLEEYANSGLSLEKISTQVPFCYEAIRQEYLRSGGRATYKANEAQELADKRIHYGAKSLKRSEVQTLKDKVKELEASFQVLTYQMEIVIERLKGE